MLSARLQETAWWLYNVDFELNTDPCHDWDEEVQLDLEAYGYCSEVLSTQLMLMSYPKS